MISSYITSRQEQDIANGTINRELSVLQAMFRLGERSTAANGKPVVDRLPAFPRKMKEGKPRKGFIKDEQFALLAANAKTPWLRLWLPKTPSAFKINIVTWMDSGSTEFLRITGGQGHQLRQPGRIDDAATESIVRSNAITAIM